MTLFQRKFRIDEKHLFTRIMLLQLGHRYKEISLQGYATYFSDIMIHMLMPKITLKYLRQC